MAFIFMAPRLGKKKKDTIEFGRPICNPLGPNNKPKMLKVGPQVFSAFTSSVKWALGIVNSRLFFFFFCCARVFFFSLSHLPLPQDQSKTLKESCM